MTKDNQRSHHRHPAKHRAPVNFIYDIDAKVDVHPAGEPAPSKLSKCHGVCKNISAEGLCFMSGQKLAKGKKLSLEFYVSDGKPPLRLKGSVRWSRAVTGGGTAPSLFDTGLKLITIEGRRVHDSVHYDKMYKLYWSDVLELISERWKQTIRAKAAKRGQQ